MKLFYAVSLFLYLSYEVKSAKILGIFPLPGHSHYLLGNTLLKDLAERGHDVTMLSCFKETSLPKNGSYRNIVIEGMDEKPGDKGKEWNMFKREGLNPFLNVYTVATMATKLTGVILAQERIQDFIKSGEKFDVVIVDQFLSDGFKAFSTVFDAPLIIMNPVYANFFVNPLVANPEPTSYIPNILLEYPVQMTFYQRMMNSLIYLFNNFLYHWLVYPSHNNFIKQYIPNGPDINDVLYNASLVLLNSHPSLNQPVPHVPNMIEVGGFHLKPPKKLPKDLQDFMDSADEGVVYFSMGSNLKSVLFPSEKREALIKAFSKLKLKVLWKWEDDELPGKPSNVKIAKWVPQRDLLAHPNIKLFITHGGFTSSIEAADTGVPVLFLPVYGDQHNNAHFAYQNGFGRFLTFKEISEETLLENINEVLTNPKYKENAVKRAELFHDREVSPMETAVYWVEYVIRHRGAPHLRVAGLDLPWYKYHLLDVIAFITLTSISMIFVSCYLLKKVWQKFCSKQKISKLKKNK